MEVGFSPPMEGGAALSPTTKGKMSRWVPMTGRLVGKIPSQVGCKAALPEGAPGMGRKGSLAQSQLLLCQLQVPPIGTGGGEGAPADPCARPPPADLQGLLCSGLSWGSHRGMETWQKRWLPLRSQLASQDPPNCGCPLKALRAGWVEQPLGPQGVSPLSRQKPLPRMPN